MIAKASTARSSGLPVVVWIVAAILVHIAAWAGWLALASRHAVAEVPVVGARR
jgi:hypothetical protein